VKSRARRHHVCVVMALNVRRADEPDGRTDTDEWVGIPPTLA